MAVNFARTSYEGRTPAIWRGECKVLPAGFKPKNTLVKGMVVLTATPLYVDYADMTAAVIKVAKVLAGGTTTKPRIAKGHYFAVGDKVTKIGGTGNPTISAIDTSNADYDVLTLSAGLTGLVEGDVVAEAEAEGVALYTPNTVVAADLEVKDKLDTIDAAYDALVIMTNVPYPILPDWVNGLCLKNNPNIMFIKQ